LSLNSTTRFAYDGLNMLAEYNGSNALQRRFVFDDEGQPIIWYEGTGTTNRRFLSADERGSIVSATDSSGALIGLNAYDEYGIPGSSNIGRFGYTGQAWLGEIGMQYSRARIYSPTLGPVGGSQPGRAPLAERLRSLLGHARPRGAIAVSDQGKGGANQEGQRQWISSPQGSLSRGKPAGL
jgi:hypothetical protein